MRDAGSVLLDRVPNPQLAAAMRERLEVDGDRVADSHLWRICPSDNAAALTIVSDGLLAAGHYKLRLAGLPGLSHVTLEVQHCSGRDLRADTACGANGMQGISPSS